MVVAEVDAVAVQLEVGWALFSLLALILAAIVALFSPGLLTDEVSKYCSIFFSEVFDLQFLVDF